MKKIRRKRNIMKQVIGIIIQTPAEFKEKVKVRKKCKNSPITIKDCKLSPTQ